MSEGSGPSAIAAVGAALAAAGVALSAYASHAADAASRAPLQSAALMALAHGIALAALARQTPRRLGIVALTLLSLGVVLFMGSLLGAHVFGLPTRLAPAGGLLLIAGWLLYAADALRR